MREAGHFNQHMVVLFTPKVAKLIKSHNPRGTPQMPRVNIRVSIPPLSHKLFLKGLCNLGLPRNVGSFISSPQRILDSGDGAVKLNCGKCRLYASPAWLKSR